MGDCQAHRAARSGWRQRSMSSSNMRGGSHRGRSSMTASSSCSVWNGASPLGPAIAVPAHQPAHGTVKTPMIVHTGSACSRRDVCPLKDAVIPPEQPGPLMSLADAVSRSRLQQRTGGGRWQQRGQLVLRLEQLLQQRLALRRPQGVQEAQEVCRVLQMCSAPPP